MKKALIALLMGFMALPAIATNTNSIVENLQELIETRDAITNAIVQKGGTVTSGALTNVPNEILSIPSGGGDNSKLVEIVERTAREITANDLTNCTAIGRGALSWNTALTSLELPESVTSIGPYAFQGDTGLKQITIPDSVEYFADTSIRDCWSGGLVVDFGGTRQTIPMLTSLSGSVSLPSRTKVLVPEALMSEWKNTNGWQRSAVSSHIYPHLDFVGTTTYVVDASGEILWSNPTLALWGDPIMDNPDITWTWNGTQTVVLGSLIAYTYGTNTFNPSNCKLAFLDRTESEVSSIGGYPWGFATNQIQFLNSDTDHTVK